MQDITLKPCSKKMIVSPVISLIIWLSVFWGMHWLCLFLPLDDIVRDFPFFRYVGKYYFIGSVLLSLFFSFVELIGYQFMWYILKADYISVKTGIIWKSDKSIPYNKLTDAEINSGPIDRKFGFADIHLQTAGSDGIEAILTGIDDYSNIQSEIRNRIKKMKVNVPTTDESVMQQILGVLQEINGKIKYK